MAILSLPILILLKILKSLGGSGTINPATGLREYGFFKNPFEAIKSVLGGGAGAIIT